MARIEETAEDKRARRARQKADYDKRRTRGIYLKLNQGTDADILDWLDGQENKQGAIKKLIRDHIGQQ